MMGFVLTEGVESHAILPYFRTERKNKKTVGSRMCDTKTLIIHTVKSDICDCMVLRKNLHVSVFTIR